MKHPLRWFLLIALAAYLATGITRVMPEERAVVRRFGGIVARPGPGLWIGWPIGIDRVDRVKVATVRRLHVGYLPELADAPGLSPNSLGRFLTGDQNLVNLQLAIDYAIREGEGGLEDFLMQQDQVEPVVRREAEALIAEWVAGHGVDEVLLTGNAALPPFVLRQLGERLDPYRLGIAVQQTSIALLSPPEEVRGAFEEVNRAQTNIRTQEYRARQEAEQRLAGAAALKYQLEQEALAGRGERLTLAQSDAEAFTKRLTQYRRLKDRNPLLLQGLWWEEIGRTLLGMRGNGRLEVWDESIGGDGIDVNQLFSPRKGR